MADGWSIKNAASAAWNTLEILSVTSHGAAWLGKMFGVDVPEFEVDAEAHTFKFTKNYEGDEHTWDDERRMELLNRYIPDSLKPFYLGWSGYEYPSDLTDWVELVKSLEAKAKFRSFVTGMDTPPQVRTEAVVDKSVKGVTRTYTEHVSDPEEDIYASLSLEYLIDVAERVKARFETNLRLNGIDPIPVLAAETLPNWCQPHLESAYEAVSAENRARGNPHRPTADEKHWTDNVAPAKEFIASAAGSGWDFVGGTPERLGTWIDTQHNAMLERRKKDPLGWLKRWL